LQLNVDENTH